MSTLKDKLENALNESRILILGAQVLIGFGFRTIFERGFSKLSLTLQEMKLVSLGMMILALGLLVSPVAYHRIVEREQPAPDLHNFTQRVITFALLPFAFAMGWDSYVASAKVLSPSYSWIFGLLVAAVALYFWYGLEYHTRRHKKDLSEQSEGGKQESMELKDKIKEVLIEARMVLPGAQALLGFQFIVVLTDAFDELPQSLKILHLSSLFSVALCTVLLIAPAAYHRIVCRGEDSEDLLQFASLIILAAMVPLAAGLATDFLIVTWMVTKSMPVALAASAAMLVLLLGFWFGYMWWLRGRKQAQARMQNLRQTRVA
ncbi:MAG: putative rane protein [Acidobacteriaceae bacterium]|nr:putative rane protein [Acidobacteriaceae bacterium]